MKKLWKNLKTNLYLSNQIEIALTEFSLKSTNNKGQRIYSGFPCF